jgi:hypothetical protein
MIAEPDSMDENPELIIGVKDIAYGQEEHLTHQQAVTVEMT